MRILITGAAGQIGTILTRGLKDRHQLRGLDLVPMSELEDTVVGNVADFDTVFEASKDMDAIIHLANVGPAWDQALQSMVSTYNVLESAAQNGARRVAYASRAGVLPKSHYPRSIQRTMDMLPKPDSYYTVTKVFGENLGFMYSSRHDLEVVCVRIGNFNKDRDEPTHPHMLSHGDCTHLFEQCLIHPGVKYEVVFGVSDSDWALYDLDHGRQAIGYYPKDKSIVPEDERK